jgi:hypothetical protein
MGKGHNEECIVEVHADDSVSVRPKVLRQLKKNEAYSEEIVVDNKQTNSGKNVRPKEIQQLRREEIFSYLIGQHGYYSKYVKLFSYNDGNRIIRYVDIRLYFDTTPTGVGVRLSVKNFEDCIRFLENTNPHKDKINKKDLKGPGFQVYSHNGNAWLWYINVLQENGKEIQIGMGWDELIRLINLKEQILSLIYEM